MLTLSLFLSFSLLSAVFSECSACAAAHLKTGGNVAVCCGKRVPVAQLDGLSAIGCAMTCNGEPAAATSSSSQVDIAGLQAQLAALVPTPPL